MVLRYRRLVMVSLQGLELSNIEGRNWRRFKSSFVSPVIRAVPQRASLALFPRDLALWLHMARCGVGISAFYSQMKQIVWSYGPQINVGYACPPFDQ